MGDDILIVGVDGLIGSELAEQATEQGLNWTGTSRRKGDSGKTVFLDLAQHESVDALTQSPQVAFLCAAATSLRECDDDFSTTSRINIDHMHRLAKNLAARGTGLVFLSTNLVFDGKSPHVGVKAATSPQNAYGRQKAEMERRLLNEFEKVAIVRLTKVVHPQFKLFKKWQEDLRSGLSISPISDLVFSPIDLSLVASELLVLARKFRPGIYQLSGDRDLAYVEAAQILGAMLGVDAKKIIPKTCAEAGLPAAGLRNTTLEYRSPSQSVEAPSVTGTLESLFQKMVSESR